MIGRFDDAVVGAGILGLAHAYHLARLGRRVVVFERHDRAIGASVRNFGMLWPIGQPAGPARDLALRSRALWLEVLRAADLWHDPVGSLHLAYHEDEAQVLAEFVANAAGSGLPVALIGPDEVYRRSPGVRRERLRVALWSPTEVCVDPRSVVAQLPRWLTATHGIQFEWATPVLGFDRPRVRTPGRDFEADRLWACTGDEFALLFPEAYLASGLVRCQLQMMRSAPMVGGWRLGPMLAAGLTLRHYRSFEHCPSLPVLRARIAADHPEFDQHGIHVMAAQNGSAEVVIGDSHAYDSAAIGPFDSAVVDALILDYLATFLDAPSLRIASRWHGTYARHPTDPVLVAHPTPGAVAITGVGGAGMTLSFGLAEQTIAAVLTAGG